jgi:peptide/nickel transport system substrate-binding protein
VHVRVLQTYMASPASRSLMAMIPSLIGTQMEPLRGDDPRRVGRYRLVARLGAGGMGQVFLGFSPAGRPMAVKVVHRELARDRAFLSRFRQEVASARKVSGAYTAAVVDAGDGDFPWLATTLVVGPSLSDAVEQQGPLPEVSMWRLAAGLAEALAEVHSCGLIHRDLKPSNVLLAVDGPRVIDFGISRALDGTALTGMTGTGMLVGTPAFMSPEQASGTPVGAASDVFSFGGVLTFAATGKGPFGDGSPVAMIYRVVHGEPVLADLPGALSSLVTRCMAKRPEDRATLPELMEIITANVDPVTSATSFWPEALAAFIVSYQARFTTDTQEWSATVAEQATPSAPPVPSESGATHDDQDGPATITTQTPPPASLPSVSVAPATSPTMSPPPLSPPPLSPPPLSPPPLSPPPRRPRRRVALAAGAGALAVLVGVVILVISLSSSPSHTGGRPRATVAAATNRQPPGGFGTIPAESGTPHAGTVSVAELAGAIPTWILPLVTAAANSTANVFDFDYQMWRPLYWPDGGVSAAIDPALSLAQPPVWSNGDKTVTITMNPRYKWSDGQPVSARDVAFDIDLIRAAIKENPGNWASYVPGYFPDNFASVSTPDASTLVLNLTSAVNPSWFYEDILATLQPMPAHAWAKAAAGGPLLDFTNPQNAKKIYDYLAAQSNATTTWSTNPLWRLVDGPFRLTAFDHTSGAVTMAANPSYGGPDSHEITTLNEVPFSSDAAEFSALQAGSVDVGYIPQDDVSQVPQVKSGGYAVFGYPDFGFEEALYNFKDTTGDFNHIVTQLYFRQAMAHLQDQQHYITAFMGGAGSPNYGPVPPIPASVYTPGNARNAYPFSLAAATNLLASHGWKVTTGGTDTCVSPGSGSGQCGAGIPAGTKLAFNLIYNTNPPIPQEVTALASEARQAGITITLVASNFDAIITNDDDPADPGNANKWAMEDFGGETASTYPTTFGAFNTSGSGNLGGYSDPQADTLISASVSGPDPNAVVNEAAYLTTQQPGLFQPNTDNVVAWKKTLSGPQGSFANLTDYFLTPEQWYFTS